MPQLPHPVRYGMGVEHAVQSSRHAPGISPYPVQAVARLGYTSISTSDARIFGEKGLQAAQY